MFLIRNIQQRLGAAVSAAIGAVLFFACGACMFFYLGPQQRGEANRIEDMAAITTAADYSNAPGGEEILVTGTLRGNEPLTEEGYVAYIVEEWDVTDSSNDNDDPSGHWSQVDEEVPALTVELDSGLTIRTAPAGSVTLGGSMETGPIQPGSGGLSADYQGQRLREGSRRMRGYRDGATITVLGTKQAAGELTPNRLYGGTQQGLVEEVRAGGKILTWLGLGFMICAPIFLITGVVGALFGRRRAAALAGAAAAAGAAPVVGSMSRRDDKPDPDFGGLRDKDDYDPGSKSGGGGVSLGGGGEMRPRKSTGGSSNIGPKKPSGGGGGLKKG